MQPNSEQQADGGVCERARAAEWQVLFFRARCTSRSAPLAALASSSTQQQQQCRTSHPPVPKVNATKYQAHSEEAPPRTLRCAIKAISMPGVRGKGEGGEPQRRQAGRPAQRVGGGGGGLVEWHGGAAAPQPQPQPQPQQADASPQMWAASMDAACLDTSSPQMCSGRCGRSTCLRNKRGSGGSGGGGGGRRRTRLGLGQLGTPRIASKTLESHQNRHLPLVK